MWIILAIAATLISVCVAILYDNGRFFYLLVIALLTRYFLIIVFPGITTADTADYLPYFRQFSILVENKGILSTIPSYVDRHVQFYTVLYPGYIYTIYGDSGLPLIRVINSCLSVISLLILNEINKLVFNKQFKRWQAVVILFWPSYVFFSVEVGRTVAGIVFILLSTYLFMLLITKFKLKYIFLFIIISLAVVMIRVYYVVYPLSLVFIMYLYKSYSNNNQLQTGITMVIIGFGSAIGISLFPYEFSIERINSLAAGIAHGNSAYLTTVYPTSFLDLTWYVPLQGIYFQFSPFLWDVFRIGSVLSIIAFTQASILILVLSATVKKIRSPHINWKFGLLILSTFVVALLLGIGVKNTGSAMRWRLPSELLILAISSTIVDCEYINKND